MSATQPISTVDRNKKLVLQWFEEVWNQERVELISELLDSQCVIHDGPLTLTGSEDFTRFYNALHKEFDNFHIEPGPILAEGDLVCLHWTSTSRHLASGKSATVTGTSVVRVQDGRFVEAWQNWDAARLAAQLPGFSLPGFF